MNVLRSAFTHYQLVFKEGNTRFFSPSASVCVAHVVNNCFQLLTDDLCSGLGAALDRGLSKM